MEASERLRQYCINDPRLLGDSASPIDGLDAQTAALVRIAALIATRGPGACFRPAVDDAVATGASMEQLVAVLDCCRGIAGVPRVVSAAQQIATAMGVADDLIAGIEP